MASSIYPRDLNFKRASTRAISDDLDTRHAIDIDTQLPVLVHVGM